MKVCKALLFLTVFLHGGLALVQNPRVEGLDNHPTKQCRQNSAMSFFLRTHMKGLGALRLKGGLSGGVLTKSQTSAHQGEIVERHVQTLSSPTMEY
eukprot:585131-Hanusia_phi.AAC.2